MSLHYNQNYTHDQTESILNIIHECIRCNRYIISKNENRKENINFIIKYNLNTSKQKEILLHIVVDDFCHSLQNTNVGFEHEILYVFCPQIVLFNFEGEKTIVDLYTKFNIIDYDNGKRVIAISFHERNKPMDYAFR